MLISNDPILALVFDHLSEFYPFSFSIDPSLCVGVDIAIIRGRLRNMFDICPCMSINDERFQEVIKVFLSLETNHCECVVQHVSCCVGV